MRRTGNVEIGITGRPEQAPRTERYARCGEVAIAAAKMHAMGIDGQGQCQIIINDAARSVLPAQRRQRPGKLGAARRIGGLVAVLHEAHATAQSGLNLGKQHRC